MGGKGKEANRHENHSLISRNHAVATRAEKASSASHVGDNSQHPMNLGLSGMSRAG